MAGAICSVRIACTKVHSPPAHSGDRKIATHPIFAALLSPSAISPPKDCLIEPRSVVDQLPLWIVPQLPNDPCILLGWIAGEHRFKCLAEVRHGRAPPDQIPRAIDHYPLCVLWNPQRVVRNELEAPAVTLAHCRIDPRVEVAVDRHDVIRPRKSLEIVARSPSADPDPSRRARLRGRLLRINPRRKAIAISALER